MPFNPQVPAPVSLMAAGIALSVRHHKAFRTQGRKLNRAWILSQTRTYYYHVFSYQFCYFSGGGTTFGPSFAPILNP